MLLAWNMGFAVLPSRFLSSCRWIRRLRLASCWCILAFTRNPFLLVLMVARYNIRRRRNTRDFELFQFIASPKRGGFACSRSSQAVDISDYHRRFPREDDLVDQA